MPKKQSSAKKRWFPWVMPRFSPKIGQKYELKHLQPLARQLFERVSELTGVPVKELLPLRMRPKFLESARYSEREHVVKIQSNLNPLIAFGSALTYLERGPKTSVPQHEIIHSLIGILGSMSRKEVDWREEAYANVGSYRFHIDVKNRNFMHHINDCYRKYGVDGLLAVFISSPRVSSHEDLIKIEENLLKENYLNSNGFTEKGIAWFKSQIPKEKIVERLRQIKKNRQELGFPA